MHMYCKAKKNRSILNIRIPSQRAAQLEISLCFYGIALTFVSLITYFLSVSCSFVSTAHVCCDFIFLAFAAADV